MGSAVLSTFSRFYKWTPIDYSDLFVLKPALKEEPNG